MYKKTPKIGHAPIEMNLVESIRAVGDFKWEIGTSGKRTLVLAIPDNKKGWCYSRWTIDHKNHCGARWSWCGNEKQPTLKPSLHAVGVWHGFVQKGKLIEA